MTKFLEHVIMVCMLAHCNSMAFCVHGPLTITAWVQFQVSMCMSSHLSFGMFGSYPLCFPPQSREVENSGLINPHWGWSSVGLNSGNVREPLQQQICTYALSELSVRLSLIHI